MKWPSAWTPSQLVYALDVMSTILHFGFSLMQFRSRTIYFNIENIAQNVQKETKHTCADIMI